MDVRRIAAVLALALLLVAAQEQKPPLRTATNLVHISVIVQDKAGN